MKANLNYGYLLPVKIMLDEFKKRPGFSVIVLSPFVAGVGLTIIEANHVIHYGRWWNHERDVIFISAPMDPIRKVTISSDSPGSTAPRDNGD